jgi:hypothetical protein
MCPRHSRKTEGGHTFTVRTIIEWNNIDLGDRKKNSVACFKYNLVEFTQVILNNQKDKHQDLHCMLLNLLYDV